MFMNGRSSCPARYQNGPVLGSRLSFEWINVVYFVYQQVYCRFQARLHIFSNFSGQSSSLLNSFSKLGDDL